jgi:hypothetical protein
VLENFLLLKAEQPPERVSHTPWSPILDWDCAAHRGRIPGGSGSWWLPGAA